MALTDIKVKTAKPKDKPYKLADGGGMYLLINTNGSALLQIVGGDKLIIPFC